MTIKIEIKIEIKIDEKKYKAIKSDIRGYCTGCVAIKDSNLCGLIRNTLANETYFDLYDNNICDIFDVVFKE